MLRTFISLNPDGVVTFVISATVAAGFFPAPRDDIQVGDVLTDQEMADLGLSRSGATLSSPSDPTPDNQLSDE